MVPLGFSVRELLAFYDLSKWPSMEKSEPIRAPNLTGKNTKDGSIIKFLNTWRDRSRGLASQASSPDGGTEYDRRPQGTRACCEKLRWTPGKHGCQTCFGAICCTTEPLCPQLCDLKILSTPSLLSWRELQTAAAKAELLLRAAMNKQTIPRKNINC